MTSLAFIFGVSPMVWAVGAGAELRQTLGTTVFSGMIGVTIFGLIFTPVFYVVVRKLTGKRLVAQDKREPVPLAEAAE
jgi:multidrug efflux pump subunit AcrB